LKIFVKTRHKILAPTEKGRDKLIEVREDVAEWSHGEVPSVDHQQLAGLDDAFVLYRRRCDVLLASSFLEDKPHRIRMSGLPACIAPWVGAILSDYTNPTLEEQSFLDLWSSRINGTLLKTVDADKAWKELVNIAGRTETSVEMKILRQRLGRKQPPAELCSAELGYHGPIIGTIHASKGRETDVVHLMLPVDVSDNGDQDEEARVVFVGATRGRKKLMIGRSYRQYAKRVDPSGRVYSLKTRNNSPKAQVEIGLEGDIKAEGLAGRRFFINFAEVIAAQKRIIEIAGKTVPVIATSDPAIEFAYRVRENGNDSCIAVFAKNINDDLFKIGRAIRDRIGGRNRRPPDSIKYLYVRGIRTIVLPPDAPECEVLHEPWANTGIMLAPLVTGYSTLYFPYY
jgi:hypothetical protein